jgi:hypothetical protein
MRIRLARIAAEHAFEQLLGFGREYIARSLEQCTQLMALASRTGMHHLNGDASSYLYALDELSLLEAIAVIYARSV